MTDRTLNIGLLGCGAIAQFAHLPAIQKAHRVCLAAVCDAAPDLREHAMRRWDAPKAYADYDQMLADDDVHAVIIAVPDAFHVASARRALQAGKHVLVEKPLGTGSAECRELIEIVRETGLKLQVGSMKRHDPGMSFASRFVREKVGKILSISAIYRDSIFRDAMQKSTLDPLHQSALSIKPEIDPKQNRAQYNLWTQGAHLFDSVRFLAGAIKAVDVRSVSNDANTTWQGLLEMSSGVGHFELTCKACADWCERYEVLGERGSVSVNVGLPFYHRPAAVHAFEGATRVSCSPLGERSNAYVNQLEAFAASVLDEAPVSPDVVDGWAAISVLEAVSESARTKRSVTVQNDPAP